MLESIYRGDKSGDSLTTPKGRDKIQNIHSILIVKDGYLVFEEYFYYWRRQSRHAQASVTKSITSLLVARLSSKAIWIALKRQSCPIS